MPVRKKWFIYLSLILFEIGAAYALYSGVTSLPGLSADPYLRYGGAVVVLAVLLLLVHGTMRLLAHINIPARLTSDAGRRTERILVASVIALSAAVRILVIIKLPIAPSSDFQTYYQVASLLAKGGLSASGYSGYIAEFPHVIGYPFILSLLYRITGPSVLAGLYLNMLMSLASVYLVYRIARTLSGRLGGLIALFIAAFWPSQILFGALLASEPAFTCLLLLCIWLFIYLFRYPARTGTVEGAVFLCIALGALLALTNAVRPLATVLLIAAVLCFVPCTVRFNKNEKMLNGKLTRVICQGWFRAGLVLAVFFVCTQFISSSISNKIAYKLPGGTASFGYNLMVGVNTDSTGTWNQQDADFFADRFASTNSAQAAHQASLDVALGRIEDDPSGIASLALEKFASLWGNDDYASYWTKLFLGQQGNLTPARQSFIEQLAQWNDVAYLAVVFFSGICALQLLRQKKVSPAQVLVLLFIGTAFLHMLLESQNRYHYFMLPIFGILASTAASNIYRRYRDNAAVTLTNGDASS